MFSKDAIMEGLAIVIGAVIAGIGSKMLPGFPHSQIVYGILGLFIVVAAVGWMSHRLLKGFAIGLGAGLGTQLYPGLTGLVSGGK